MTNPRVWGWQTDGAACTYYRLHLPLTTLTDTLGWTTNYGYGLPPNLHDPGAQPDWDVVVASRLAAPSDVDHWETLCARSDVLCVYDLDDDLLHIDPANHGPWELYEPLRPHVERALRAAHRVTASTAGLAGVVQSYNPNVTVIPNCLHPGIFDLPRPRADGVVTVGWGGSMFHAQDWPGIVDQLAAVRDAARRAGIPVGFHTVGADYTAGRLDTRVTGWSDHHTYHRALDFDIGIAPIAETPFNRSKSWLKVLEYAARGIVPVATAWGQYPEFITDGETGYLVLMPDDWQDSICDLLVNTARRGVVAAAAEDEARNWTITRRAHLWETALTP